MTDKLSPEDLADWRMAARHSSVVGWPICGPNGESICNLSWLPNDHPAAKTFNAQSKVRGQLIVAAPDLLRALEGLLLAVNPADRGGISLHEWNTRLKAASKIGTAAVNKARQEESQ